METTRLEGHLRDRLADCCEEDVDARIEELSALSGSVPDEERGDLSALSVLSDGTRYRLARYLAAAEGELCVCELTELVAVSESATSHALSDLAGAGLVTRRKDGQWRYYDATERTERLLGALDATRGER